MKLSYRAVFISDTHLGSRGAQTRDLIRFLRCIECDRLYLVGDIVDFWRLRGRSYWPSEHNSAIQEILKLVHAGTRVAYIPGNHDEAVRPYEGLAIGGVDIKLQDIHETLDGRRFLVTHGDEFDLVVRHSAMLSKMGGAAYETLIVMNRWYNRVRRALGYDYWSLAQFLKLKVKRACTYVSQFEESLVAEAQRRDLDGVICGHIHKPERRLDLDAEYFNCGDWIESCTAVVEHLDGTLDVVEALPTIAQLVRHQRDTEMREGVAAAAP